MKLTEDWKRRTKKLPTHVLKTLVTDHTRGLTERQRKYVETLIKNAPQ